MLNGFYAEAMQFLGVPKAAWAEMRIGVVFGEDGKADVTPYIDYANARILVCLPVIKMMLQMNPAVTADSPSVYRSNGYKLARMWQQYLKDGLQRDFLSDKDSWDFATALSLLKGINYADVSKAGAEIIKALTGFEVLDINAAIQMLRDEFGIDCKVSQATDQIHKVKRAVVTLTDGERRKRADELKRLYDESTRTPLPKIEEGQLGSRSNPFQNVDDAAAYILQIERERLAADPYRQAISDEQYFFDMERGFFRIPWASANVSYYSLGGAISSGFVVNQLSQRPGHLKEMPRFSIKPSLVRNKFLYRGQSQFYENCVPSLFRNKENVADRQFVSDIIQMNELEVLLRQQVPELFIGEQELQRQSEEAEEQGELEQEREDGPAEDLRKQAEEQGQGVVGDGADGPEGQQHQPLHRGGQGYDLLPEQLRLGGGGGLLHPGPLHGVDGDGPGLDVGGAGALGLLLRGGQKILRLHGGVEQHARGGHRPGGLDGGGLELLLRIGLLRGFHGYLPNRYI